MPQVQLPIFPVGTTAITPELGFERRDHQVVYLNGHLPVFTHEVDDLASFGFLTTPLILNGTASQGQIAQAFGVPLRTVKRYCRQYREGGASAFFKPAAGRQGSRLTPERLVEVQALLDQGQSVPQISRQTGLLATTLHKAIDQGRLKQIKKRGAWAKRQLKQQRHEQEPAQRGRSAGGHGSSHHALGGTLTGFPGPAASRADPL